MKFMGQALVGCCLAAAFSIGASGTSTAVDSKAAGVGLAGRPLQQVAMTTTDLPRAIRFYHDTLGLPLLFVANDMAFFDVAGMRLMIAVDRARRTAVPTTILYFDVADFDAKVSSLKSAGVTLQGGAETVRRDAAGDLKLQQFVDPDGNALAVMGLVAKS